MSTGGICTDTEVQLMCWCKPGHNKLEKSKLFQPSGESKQIGQFDRCEWSTVTAQAWQDIESGSVKTQSELWKLFSYSSGEASVKNRNKYKNSYRFIMKNIQHFELNISYFSFLREETPNPETEG